MMSDGSFSPGFTYDIDPVNLDEFLAVVWPTSSTTMSFRRKSETIQASRWWMNGDHPDDASVLIKGDAGPFLSEGKVVRRFNRHDVDHAGLCPHCNHIFHIPGGSDADHGWIDGGPGGRIVCPGDWILTIGDQHFPIKPDLFEAIFEAAPDEAVIDVVVEGEMEW